MGPTRTSASKLKEHSSTDSNVQSEKRRIGKKSPRSDDAAGTGVQKLKSALRQTRRLLAKDNLAADVRVETERRLKSLEGDIEVAELRKKERALAVRYHKVKFFERQKVTRKINQMKKQISSLNETKVSLAGLESSLLQLRVDLNYIIHFPKMEKYISLFPPSHSQSLEPEHEPESSNSSTDSKREEIRSWIRTKMDEGELSPEPELVAVKKDEGRRVAPRDEHFGAGQTKIKDRHIEELAKEGKHGTGRRNGAPKAKVVIRDKMAVDDFFDVEGA